MTKKEALNMFKQLYPVGCFVGPNKKMDKPARREAWGIWTDELCKAGKITVNQYENWLSPFDK